MFKRKLLVIIIPVLATSVLVGAGFGAWYFDSSYIRLEKSLGVKVEDKVETFGFIETSLPDDTVLKIDQGGFFNKEDLTKKICLYSASTEANNGIISSFNVNYFIKKDDANGLAFNNTVAQLTSTATLNNKVATYISIINNAMTILESNNVIFDLKPTAIETIDSVDYYKYTHTMEVKPSDDLTSPSFIYNVGKKPTTKEAHSKMQNDLSDVTNALTINFSLTYKKGS
ncbi:MAG: hypothetical protein SOY58_03390 [Candidatus Onthovivens sp.]|nr:hypothetical protein [Candidatus Onthovivens sp.]